MSDQVGSVDVSSSSHAHARKEAQMTPEQAIETLREAAEFGGAPSRDREAVRVLADALAERDAELHRVYDARDAALDREAGTSDALQDAVAERDKLRAALTGWETRDNDGHPPCSVERGSVERGDWELLVAGIPYDAGCAIEGFFERALGSASQSEPVGRPKDEPVAPAKERQE